MKITNSCIMILSKKPQNSGALLAAEEIVLKKREANPLNHSSVSFMDVDQSKDGQLSKLQIIENMISEIWKIITYFNVLVTRSNPFYYFFGSIFSTWKILKFFWHEPKKEQKSPHRRINKNIKFWNRNNFYLNWSLVNRLRHKLFKWIMPLAHWYTFIGTRSNLHQYRNTFLWWIQNSNFGHFRPDIIFKAEKEEADNNLKQNSLKIYISNELTGEFAIQWKTFVFNAYKSISSRQMNAGIVYIWLDVCAKSVQLLWTTKQDKSIQCLENAYKSIESLLHMVWYVHIYNGYECTVYIV